MENTKGKILTGIISGVLTIALLSASAIGGFFAGRYSSKNQLNAVQEYTTTNDPITVNDGTFLVERKSSNGINLMSQTIDIHSAYLTATIYPDTVTDKTVTWNLSWANPSSAWASGKSVSNYVAFSVSSDTLTITLTCVSDFGEQIIATCTSSSNSSVSATATLDYERRIVGSNLYLRMLDSAGSDILNLSTTDQSYDIDFPTFSDKVLNDSQNWAYDAGNYTAGGCTVDNTQNYLNQSYSYISYTYSAYTVLPNWELSNYPSTYDKVYVAASDWYLDCLNLAGFTTTVSAYEEIPINITNYYGKESAHVSFAGIFLNSFSSATDYQSSTDEGPTSTRWNNLKYYLYNMYNGYESQILRLKFESYSYADDTLLSTNYYTIHINKSSLITSATAVALSDSNLVF
jgi:hypothetical protein